jgi:hypothetical protein
MLCSEGVSGKEIMEALVANSATFHTKTAFSQVPFVAALMGECD